MFVLYVLPAGEDQGRFANSLKPLNTFRKAFVTKAEETAYLKGLHSVSDLTGYSIERESATTLSVEFDGEDAVLLEFDSETEKQAYKDGMDDGDGFVSPEVIGDDDANRFELISKLYTS
jgi:hypothetical protein